MVVTAHASIIRGTLDICATDRNYNMSEMFISIFMSVTLTHSRSYLMLDPRLRWQISRAAPNLIAKRRACLLSLRLKNCSREPRPPTDCRNALRFEDGDDLVRARIDDEDVVAD